MRVLMLAQNYPPTIGGEEQHVRKLSIELARRGHDVAVVALRDDRSPDFVTDEGVRVYRIGGILQRFPQLFSTDRRQAPPFPDPETVLELQQIIARERPEIVHAHNWMVYAFLPLKARSGASLVLSLHDYSLLCLQKRMRYHNRTTCEGPGLRKCFACALTQYGVPKGIVTAVGHRAMRPVECRAVDMFLPVSPAVAAGNRLDRACLPHQVIPNFVSSQVHAPAGDIDPLLQALPNGEFLLYVGELMPDKGVNILLQAVAEIEARPPLVMIGRTYTNISPTDFPPNVQVIPGWPHPAVLAAWSASTLALVPSIVADSSPTVAIEAMTAGIPVIASRIGGLPELVADEVTGLLIPPGDVGALRDAIKRLLADPELRHRMGQAALKRVKLFQADTVVPQIEQVYERVRTARIEGRARPQCRN